MANNLDSFFPNINNTQVITQYDKILCIIEGGDELSFIKRVYEVYNNSIECQDFVNNKIKLSYGMEIIEWQGNTHELKAKSREKCNFQGGDTQEGYAPKPILHSLNNEDLELYPAIIVMFDKDRDIDDLVEREAREILQEYSNKVLFLSSPCFEKESMTFFMNEKIKKYISDNYSIIDGSSCLWFKRNYSNCISFNPIKNAKKLTTMIDKLEKAYLENSNIDIEMSNLIKFISIHT
ncbi:MAG: hypothetical protein QM493_05300 [Sulfurovum sp.]